MGRFFQRFLALIAAGGLFGLAVLLLTRMQPASPGGLGVLIGLYVLAGLLALGLYAGMMRAGGALPPDPADRENGGYAPGLGAGAALDRDEDDPL